MDITLEPHSPLALASVLSQTGGYLDLVPRHEEEAKQPLQDIATASSRSEHKPSRETCRDQRQRFNLLTQHCHSDLLKQCKRILVENALVKCKDDRQLYLAAGFVSWPDPQQSSCLIRAPLLLYPALLVRIPDQQSYEVRLAGDTPEFNVALAQHIEQQYDISLSVYTEDAHLVDYFAQVAASLSSSQALDLEFEVALGSASFFNASPTQEPVVLPEIPEQFDVALAMSIAGNKKLDDLNALLQLIPDFTDSCTVRQSIHADNETKFGEPKAPTNLGTLRSYAAKLASEGLDHIEFRKLTTLPSLMARWTDLMTQAAFSVTVTSLPIDEELSARELIKLAGIIELIDKAPDSIDQWAHGDLCFANSTILLRRAQHQAKLIEDELTALQADFHLDKVPAKSKLLSLMNELGEASDSDPELVDVNYFNARRQFMEFSTRKPSNLTTEHRRSLSQLAKVMRFRELFVNNIEYRSAFGAGYKGLRTDWDLLAQISNYSRELAEVLGSESLAAAILNNWEHFRLNFSKDLEVLQQGGQGARRLLGVVGKRWHKQPVSALTSHAAMIAGRLEEWQVQYGQVESHADRTPDIVLSSFSTQSMDNVMVETRVDETHRLIAQQLADGDINLKQINTTLGWLKEATEAAILNKLDIDCIIDHLHIA